MHAAADGSFGRSAAGSTARGVLLLGVALLLGIVLLQSTDRSPTLSTTEKPPVTSPATTAAPATTTTTVAPAAHDPKTVKVLAANGSTVNGLADKTRLKLQESGYNALTAVTATTKVHSSVVYFAAGFDQDAHAIATLLSLAPTAVQPLPAKAPAPNVAQANVVVLAGPDLVAVVTKSSTTTARSSTATTARPATTTTAKPATSTTSTTKKP